MTSTTAANTSPTSAAVANPHTLAKMSDLNLIELEKVFGLPPKPDPKSERSAADAADGGAADANGLVTPKVPQPLKRRGSGGGSGGVATVTLLSAQRSNNVEIALTRLRLSVQQIMDAISSPTGADGGLLPRLANAETLGALLAMMPTAEELDLIRGHVSSKGTAGLARVERFFLAVCEMGAELSGGMGLLGAESGASDDATKGDAETREGSEEQVGREVVDGGNGAGATAATLSPLVPSATVVRTVEQRLRAMQVTLDFDE